MLARRHPFLRATVTATLTAVVSETPRDVSAINPTVPPAVAGIVRRCCKGARGSLASAHEVAVDSTRWWEAPTGSASLQEVEERCPYPGLSSFTEKDAAVFFGREEEIAALWARIRARRCSP